MTKPTPSAAQLVRDCSLSYQAALAGAKREIKGGVFQSRGRWVRVMVDGESVVDNGEIEFKGTQKQLDEILAKYGNLPGLEAIYIEGGVNWAASMSDMHYGNYEPWVTEWAVNILVKE